MAARRCEIGCETWPDEEIFVRCTYCGERTKRIGNIEPTISFEEARSIKLHELFDLYYDRRCASMGITSDGPLVAR